jgi:hypothetical protein
LNQKPLISFQKSLQAKGIETYLSKHHFECTKETKHFSFYVSGEDGEAAAHKNETSIPIDYIYRSPEKITSLIHSKLQANKKIFARKCEIKKVDRETARHFLDTYHIMDSTQSASNLGLYYANELIALASFSKGRKMNRLSAHQRSFELIRFCTKSGFTLTGGLSRLIKKFCEEKKAGDVMTYIDKELFDGRSFIAAGFKKHSETDPNYFLINKSTFERIPFKEDERFDAKKFYLTHNSGSLKLVYTPGE